MKFFGVKECENETMTLNDFPKEVDKVRKVLYPIIKVAKREKAAYFNVAKLIINRALYCGKEHLNFLSMGI